MSGGWVIKELGDICALRNGRAYKKSELLHTGKYRVLRVGNFFTNNHWYYSDLELNESKYCKHGDLLYAWSASFGPRIWEQDKVIFHYHIWRVDFDATIVDKRFLYYWFLWDSERIKKEQGAGTTMVHVSMKSMSTRRIKLPPIPEQKRIVAILDEAFAGIETAIANTEKNLANARELFESYLNLVFKQANTEWKEAKLKNLTSKIGSGATPKGGSESYKIEGISLIRSLNVHDRFFKQHKLAYIDSKQAERLSNVIVNENDVLFNITGASIARCCVVPSSILPARVNQHVAILRPRNQSLNTDFFCYLMTSKTYKDRLLSIGDEGGSTRQAITKSQLQELVVKFPEFNKQLEIVSVLKSIECESLRLANIYLQKLSALKELKQSLLQKAFSGELTSNTQKEIEEAIA